MLDVVGIRDLDLFAQPSRERRGRLLRALLLARENRIDARDHVHVLQKVREPLRPLAAARVERRIGSRSTPGTSVSACRTKIIVVVAWSSKNHARPSATTA